MTSATKILLTGATGYVGGSVLDGLIKNQEPSVKPLTFDLLVRTEDAAARLREAYGDRVNPILWPGGLTNLAFITDTAANYDIIINPGCGFIADGAKAFVQGLARRVKPGQPAPWLLHISGCTNLSDRPITRPETADPTKVWNDADGSAVFEGIRALDAEDPYPQRTAEVSVLTAAEETGVNAVSLNAPLIFGEGTGLFNRQGLVVTMLMRYVMEHGYGFSSPNKTSAFDWVHIEDLADVFILLTRLILEREDRGVGHIPTGKSGIIFPAVGRALHTELIQMALDAAFEAGDLPREGTPKEKEIRELTLQEVADDIMAGMVDIAERGWAGHKAMNGTVARRLGWEPRFLEDAFRRDFADELKAIKEGRRGVDTLETCVAKAP